MFSKLRVQSAFLPGHKDSNGRGSLRELQASSGMDFVVFKKAWSCIGSVKDY